MDANFLEFFGQMLIKAAKDQRQMDQFGQWMRQGFSAADMSGMSDYFQRIYGFADITKESEQYPRMVQKAQADFLAAFGEFSGLLGLVPEKKYKALQQKFDALEEKYQAREKMIAQLRTKLKKGDDPTAELTGQLTDLIERQNSEFTKTVKSLGKLFDPPKKG